MSKYFKNRLFIVILVMIFTMQLGSVAIAATTISTKFGYPLVYKGSICTDLTITGLGNVVLNPTFIGFSIFDYDISYENLNPANNADPAEGTAHVGSKIIVSQQITADQIIKNGSAEIIGLCISDEAITAPVLPNPQWTNTWYELHRFNVEWVVTTNGIDQHVVQAACVPDEDNSGFFECTIYSDSLWKK